MQEWKLQEKTAGVEIAGVKIARVDSSGGKCRSGKYRSYYSTILQQKYKGSRFFESQCTCIIYVLPNNVLQSTVSRRRRS